MDAEKESSTPIKHWGKKVQPKMLDSETLY